LIKIECEKPEAAKIFRAQLDATFADKPYIERVRARPRVARTVTAEEKKGAW
jgi:hypothetical protein